MRILIDAYQMNSNVTGTDRTSRNVLPKLQELDRENEYLILVNADQPYVSEIISAPNFKVLPKRFKRRGTWLYLGLPLLCLRLRVDVFYSFHNLLAPWPPVCYRIASALDLVPFLNQKTYYKGFVDYWLRRNLVLGYQRLAGRYADHFIANSGYTRDQVAAFFRRETAVFSLGSLQADDTFFKPVTSGQDAAMRKRYGIHNGGYIFTLGAAEPRKNVASLIQAHRGLSDDLRAAYPLIIGGAKWQNESITIEDDPYVSMTGFIDDADLPAVFAGATVFAFPTRYEGFGLPALEAMAAGTPVLTTNVTSLPEVVGDAALLVAPDDIEGMTSNLMRLLTEESLRRDLIGRGHEQVKKFSWQKYAEVLHDVMTTRPKAR